MQVGDRIMIAATIAAITSLGEDYCNIQAQTVIPMMPGTDATTLTLNAGQVELVDDRQDVPEWARELVSEVKSLRGQVGAVDAYVSQIRDIGKDLEDAIDAELKHRANTPAILAPIVAGMPPAAPETPVNIPIHERGVKDFPKPY